MHHRARALLIFPLLWTAAACVTGPVMLPSAPLMGQPENPYLQEVATEEPLGHWSLKGDKPGIVDRAMVFGGASEVSLAAPDLGGGAFTAAI
jgi:hypothetical protein